MTTESLPLGRRLRLPRLKRVSLRSFSLYAGNPDAGFEAPAGVLCLIGANGIGKSTLLASINFCLTGIVPEPDRKFESIDEYYQHSQRYSNRFFEGRIAEKDRADAEVRVSVDVGTNAYELCRGIFNPQELRQLTITDTTTKQVLYSGANDSPLERQQNYATRLAADIGLAGFPEFVFLQHFVFTFDERRITLFWNERVLETVLFLAFGFDANIAKKVDQTRRLHEAADSQVRNRQWDATKLTKQISELRAKEVTASERQETYARLSGTHEGLPRPYWLGVKKPSRFRVPLSV